MEIHLRENSDTPERPREWIWIVAGTAVLVIALVLAYTGIGNHAFWDDEANTALFARNLNDTGTLTGWDGRNLIGYRYGAELNQELVNVFFPPVQYAVAAIGMTIGGETTIGGRWLFTLFGVLAIFVTMIWSRLLFKSTEIAVISGLILSVMPTYLLYIRQCRYYSLGVLFSIGIWMLMSLRPVGLSGRLSVYAGLVVITIILIFTHYLNALAAVAVAGCYLLLPQYRNRETSIRLLLVTVTALVCGIYILTTANPFSMGGIPDDATSGIERTVTLIWWHLQGLGSFEFVPLLLLPLLLIFGLLKMSGVPEGWTRSVLMLFVMLFAGLLVTALVSPQPVSITSVADMRYLVPLIPLGAMLSAVAVRMLYILQPLAGTLVLVLLVGTNVFYGSFLGQREFGSTLVNYVAELRNDYTSGTEALVEAISRLPDERVIKVYPDFMVYPPMYYEPGKLYCCQLSTEKSVEQSLRPLLGEYLYAEYAVPDNIFVPAPFLGQLLDNLDQAYGEGRYVIRERIDHYWRDLTRPELPWRSFDPPSGSLNQDQGWVLLERANLH